MTFILVLIFRKSDEHNDEKYLESDDPLNVDSKSYDNLKKDNTLRLDLNKVNYEALWIKKEKEKKENLFWKLFRDVAFYSFFIMVVIIVAIANKDTNTYGYQKNLKKLFGISSFSDGSLKKVNQLDDVWSWTETYFLKALSSKTWYNGRPTKLNKYLFDYSSIIIGNPILRQLRVKNGNFYNS